MIAGGGTGGHLYPGIAVAREWLVRDPDAAISFAGTASGIESRVIPHEGFALDVIRSGGLKGKGLRDSARGAVLVPFSLADAWRVISRRRPDIVIGVGGYSSGPVVLVAAMRGIATMLLEQNALPGLTNRLLARVVRSAAVTYESTKSFFGEKAFVSGNPVRPEIMDAVEGVKGSTDDRSIPRVLIFGGSQGAHAINLAMVAAAPELAAGRQLRVTHQTGAQDLEMVRSAYEAAGIDAEVEAFMYDMGRRLAEADLVVCRAGATTLAELTAAGRPAVLIPLPTATDDHQRKNAETLVAAGAAELLPQAEMNGRVLAARILTLAGDGPRRSAMGQAARRLAQPEAARLIVDRAMQLAKARAR